MAGQIQIVIDKDKIDGDLEWFPVVIDLSKSFLADMWTELSIDPDDDFTGSDGDPVNPVRWQHSYGTGSIQGNKFRGTSDDGTCDIVLNARFRGGFDIQFDFDIITDPTACCAGLNLQATFQDDDGTWAGGGFEVQRNMGGTDGYRAYKDPDGSSGAFGTQTNRNDSTGKLRITKVGKLFTAYAWYNSQWNVIDTMTQTSSQRQVRINIRWNKWADNPPMTADVDNFTVNSADERIDRSLWRKFYVKDEDGNKLYAEIEHWDNENQEGAIHVAIPEVSSSEDTSLYLVYDADFADQDEIELSIVEASDDFTGADGDPPDTSLWSILNGDPDIQSNKLFFETSSGLERVGARWNIVGDFDIQWDFDLTTYPNTSAWALGFRAYADGDNFFHTRIEYDSARRYKKFAKDGGSIEGVTEVNTSDTSGKMRITRTGDVFRAYRDSGGWVQIGSDSDIAGASGKAITFYCYAETWTGNPTMEGTIDNFVVNSADKILPLYRVNDDFTGDNGDPPDPTKWRGKARINNNKLRFDRAAGETSLTSRFMLDGDFDIEIPVDFVADPEVHSWYFHFMIRNPVNGYYCHFEYGYFSQLPGPTHQLGTRFRWYDGSLHDTDLQDGAQTTGKWRLTRVGDTVSAYYDYNGGWVKLDDDGGGSVGTNPIVVIAGIAYWSGTPDDVIDVDNFTVNSADAITGWVGDPGEYPAQQVWGDDFQAVYHMAQDPSGGAGAIKDSTRNASHLTPGGTMLSGDLVDGKVGKALDFDGIDDNLTHATLLDTPPANGAISILAKPTNDSETEGKRLMTKPTDETGGTVDLLDIRWVANAGAGSRIVGVRKFLNDVYVDLESVTEMSSAEYMQIMTSWGADTFQLFINGLLEDSDADTDTFGSGTIRDFILGAYNWGGTLAMEFPGIIDEVRVYQAQPSAAWEKATYNSLFGLLLGPVGGQAPATPSITSVTGITENEATLNGSTFSDPDPGDAHYSSQWQVDLQAGDFSTPEYDSGETQTDKTSHEAIGLLENTAYKGRVRYRDDSGELLWSEWSTPYNFSTIAIPEEPYTPSITSVTDLQKTQARLNGSVFSDPDPGDVHESSQWQVDLQSEDFSTPEYDSGETFTDLTDHLVLGLTGEIPYKGRVRYKDDSGDAGTEWSNWSTPYNFTTKGDWTGIIFSNQSPPDQTEQVEEGTPILLDITDNWYSFLESDIKILVEGVEYTSAAPETAYQNITDGKRLTWTPGAEYDYGRGIEINIRVDAKNSHADESFVEWLFYSWRFSSKAYARLRLMFRSLVDAPFHLIVIFRQETISEAQMLLIFRQAAGINAKGVDFETNFYQYWKRRLKGEGEPTVFICELKRFWGDPAANVAEIGDFYGEGSSNIYAEYLIHSGGDANIQAYQYFLVPAGSADVMVTFTLDAEGAALIGIPTSTIGEGAANIYEKHQGVWIRVNAIPPEVRAALEAIGVDIDA